MCLFTRSLVRRVYIYYVYYGEILVLADLHPLLGRYARACSNCLSFAVTQQPENILSTSGYP